MDGLKNCINNPQTDNRACLRLASSKSEMQKDKAFLQQLKQYKNAECGTDDANCIINNELINIADSIFKQSQQNFTKQAKDHPLESPYF